MLEIFRMQLGQILGGRMKWLMALCLTMPVLLTFAAVGSGGLDEIKNEIEGGGIWGKLRVGIVPDTSKRVIWEGEDLSFTGQVVLKENGVFWRGKRSGSDRVLMVNNGYLLIVDGELWIDESKRDSDRHTSISSSSRQQLRVFDGEDIPITLETISAIYLFLLYPQVICLLLALFYGTSVLGHELDGKTLTYLFTRPLPRWKFVVGKYLGIITALSLPTCASLFACWLLLGGEGGISLLTALLVATVGALAAHNAIFILFGFLIPRRAMIVALLYGIVFEFILSFVPALVNEFTVTYYLRSVVVGSLDLAIPDEIARIVGGASIPFALFALAAIVVSTLGIASWLAARKEFVVSDSA